MSLPTHEMLARFQIATIRMLEYGKDLGTPVGALEERPTLEHGFYARYGKRALDALSAIAALTMLSPVLVIVAVLIKLTSRGPVFFRQVRIGRGSCPFRILKFRSMTITPSAGDLRITVAGDPRVTRIGRFLRRYKMDELPQLWNVVCGHMSLVGPRPEVPAYVEEYTSAQRLVLSVRPGITDLASLAYRYEEEILAGHADPESYYREKVLPDKLMRNLTYLSKIALQTDLRIIARTIASSFLFVEKRQ